MLALGADPHQVQHLQAAQKADPLLPSIQRNNHRSLPFRPLLELALPSLFAQLPPSNNHPLTPESSQLQNSLPSLQQFLSNRHQPTTCLLHPVPNPSLVAHNSNVSTKTSMPEMGQTMGGNNQLAQSGKGLPMPNLSGKANGPIGNLLKGPVDDTGKLKSAALMVGIKLDLEAEVHVTARIRGDVLVGLY
ncbi:hypothetical protein MKZ38_008309 [Zalerion maritima]|uniref:Uncharacterized protein n=1 Tax=Zalerion maritima TaxID=339359 RepID=A0AAD5RHQ0_9PEZI|nr:hypothetical protein MKZ38_008309 [Zalerion maritima]